MDFIRKNCNPDEPKLLFLDSHNSRENESALLKLRDNNVKVITFPPHNTHILQPFDVVIARMLKAHIRKYFNKYIKNDINFKKDEIIYLLILAIEAGWKTSINSVNAITAFSTTGIFPFDSTNPLQSKYVIDSFGDPEMTELTNGKLRTTSRELTSDEYILELKQRDSLKQFDSNMRLKVANLVNIRDEEIHLKDIQNLKNLLMFKPKKFLHAIENIIEREDLSKETEKEEVFEPSPITFYFNASLFKMEEIALLDQRKTEWVHKRVMIQDGTPYKQKIREFLTIAESTLGLSIPDFRVEDSFRREADKYEMLTLKRYEEIIENLEKIAGYHITDILQALWLLARIAAGTLEKYIENFEELPLNPLDELLQFKEHITMSEELLNSETNKYHI